MMQCVPDWFVTQQQLKIWHDDDEDNFFEWYDGYQKRKAQKAQIKKQLVPTHLALEVVAASHLGLI